MKLILRTISRNIEVAIRVTPMAKPGTGCRVASFAVTAVAGPTGPTVISIFFALFLARAHLALDSRETHAFYSIPCYSSVSLFCIDVVLVCFVSPFQYKIDRLLIIMKRK